ncbi:MAG: LytTR family transcriptional regulator [Lachnospiraceae bacterium]|nr:LytTR family transcriptional regulator [Lachnospiraceae bacterium]
MPGGNGIKMEKGFIPMINMERYSLILHCKNGITRINLEKLVYCEAAGRRLYFYLNNEKVLECIGSMDELYQKLLEYENFIRPNRVFLINMEYIQNISCKTILMDNCAEISIPHGKYSEIKNRYLEYAFSRKKAVLL